MSNDETSQTSRRRILQGGLTIVAASAMARAANAQAPDPQRLAQEKPAQEKLAQEKLAQNLVQYQDTPKDGAKCSACVNYVDPGACKIVEGKINPNGWCVAYAPKEG